MNNVAFIKSMPKAELHVHLEGTLEPDHILLLAQRNRIELDYNTPEEILAAYDFHDLPSFLQIYYAGMSVLRSELDFYELAYHYFNKAKENNIVYVELFFDPQAHTSRGVAFDTVMQGVRRAQHDAELNLGIESNLIMCFLRDRPVASAIEHLEMSMPYREWIIGVGLDSNEFENPPAKFKSVFDRARKAGYRLTMHCDVNQKNTHQHIRECLSLIGVDRIDHGINALEDDALVKDIVDRGLGLTVCPISNHYVVQSYTSVQIKDMLEKNMKVMVNSDDPAYFRAYLNDNLIKVAQEGDLIKDDIIQLVRNGFEVSWLSGSRKQYYLDMLESYIKAN